MADNNDFDKDVEEIFGETKGEIRSDDPIVQKCLDIVRNKNVKVFDSRQNGWYRVEINGMTLFSVDEWRRFDGRIEYTLIIDHQSYKFYGEYQDLKELCRLCKSKCQEQAPERKNDTLDFLAGFDKEEKPGKKHLTPGQRTGIVCMLGGLLIMAGGVINGVISYVDYKKTQRVNKQVKAYEKTLPAEYLEYKQAVEHYRDSLMRSKGR